jgi:FAD/FMN-containing dehydrogenase
VVLPATVEDVQALVQWAMHHTIGLVPSGGRTGLSGGAVAQGEEVVVGMERMRHIVSVDAGQQVIVVQCGMVTAALQEAAKGLGLFYPVDFASRGSSQIGGNIATNAGGIKVLRYGLTRNWVTGLKVVTGTGELLELNRGLVKNATGYDLRHLFIGSEGTLGIIVEATLQLIDPPPPQQVAVFGLHTLEAVMEVLARMRRRLTLSAFEFFTEEAVRHVVAAGGRRPFDPGAGFYVLAEFDEDEAQAASVFAECHAAGIVVEGVLSQSAAQAADLWRLRESITESLARYQPYKNDIAVRVARVPAFLARIGALFAREYPDFEVIWFGHIGDGNLHISILPPVTWSREAFDAECERVTHKLGELLREFGGSVSAEHGIGLLKRPYLHYTRSPAEIELMRQVKRVFDPAGIMNPGKLFQP